MDYLQKGTNIGLFSKRNMQFVFICLSPQPLFVRKKSAKKPPFVRNFFHPFGVELPRYFFLQQF